MLCVTAFIVGIARSVARFKEGFMAHVNSIAGLRTISVKPMAWRLKADIDGRYRLEFIYVDPARGEPWVPVMTARGRQKRYASANAALADIAKVQSEAVIYWYSY